MLQFNTLFKQPLLFVTSPSTFMSCSPSLPTSTSFCLTLFCLCHCSPSILQPCYTSALDQSTPEFLKLFSVNRHSLPPPYHTPPHDFPSRIVVPPIQKSCPNPSDPHPYKLSHPLQTSFCSGSTWSLSLSLSGNWTLIATFDNTSDTAQVIERVFCIYHLSCASEI